MSSFITFIGLLTLEVAGNDSRSLSERRGVKRSTTTRILWGLRSFPLPPSEAVGTTPSPPVAQSQRLHFTQVDSGESLLVTLAGDCRGALALGFWGLLGILYRVGPWWAGSSQQTRPPKAKGGGGLASGHVAVGCLQARDAEALGLANLRQPEPSGLDTQGGREWRSAGAWRRTLRAKSVRTNAAEEGPGSTRIVVGRRKVSC